LDKILWIL